MVKALAARGDKAGALRYAESCRGPWTNDADVDATSEEILLSSGLIEEAYRRYGVRTNRGTTYLATFRAVTNKYPHKDQAEVLADLVNTTPGEEGKWFAAAKAAGLYDEALALAGRDAQRARSLVTLDDRLDGLDRELFERSVTLDASADQREWAFRMHELSRQLERAGDHAVDIGEQVYFFVTGEFSEFEDSDGPSSG